MSGIAEVGATGVELKEHQCSINKITVSTKWKAPTENVSETVSATAYDSTTAGDEKTIYLISSPEGKKVTIKTEREEGECQRESHKKYQMVRTDYKKEEKEEGGKDDKESEKKENKDNQSDISYSRIESKFNVDGLAFAAAKDAALSSVLPVLLPFNLIRTPIKIEQEIKNESEFKIKCFEIGGAFEALKYLSLPIPLGKETATQFSHISCKDGPIHYQVISYPDISFKFEISIGTGVKKWKKEEVGEKDYVKLSSEGFEIKKAEEENEGTVSGKAEKINEVPGMLKSVVGGMKNAQFDFSLSELEIAFEANYNGKKSKIEIQIGIGEIIEIFLDDKKANDEESDELTVLDKNEFNLFHIKYKHYSSEKEIDSQSIMDVLEVLKKYQDISSIMKRLIAIVNLLRKIYTLDFLKKFINLCKSDMAKAMMKTLKESYKPYSFKVVNPSVSLSFEWKYNTSENLTMIGRCIDINASCEPLIGLCFKLDLLFLLLNAFTEGAITGVYVLVNNLDKVLKEVLGEDYEKFIKDYNEDAPVNGKVYIDLEITGTINASFQYVINTVDDDEYSTTPIDGELKLDLKAGVKGSTNLFYMVTAKIEVSGSATSGLKMSVGLENRIMEGEGLIIPVESFFNGLKLKACVMAVVGLKKSKKSNIGVGGEWEKKLWDKMKIEKFCGNITLFKDKSNGGGGR